MRQHEEWTCSTPTSSRSVIRGAGGVIVTWNGPVVSLGIKVIPTLAAGNRLVVKPSEFTPFAPYRR
ncbi:aldehyde dehydrogenase family protein [Streptomyces sp. NPDC002276]